MSYDDWIADDGHIGSHNDGRNDIDIMTDLDHIVFANMLVSDDQNDSQNVGQDVDIFDDQDDDHDDGRDNDHDDGQSGEHDDGRDNGQLGDLDCGPDVSKVGCSTVAQWRLPNLRSWTWSSMPMWYYMYQTICRINITSYNIEYYADMDHIQEVHDGIFISSLGPARDEATLRRRGIGAIVNLSGYKYETGLPQLNIVMDDAHVSQSDESLYLKKFGAGMKFIKRYRLAGHRVLVHCAAGINRSATLIAFHLMRQEVADYDGVHRILVAANERRNLRVLTNPSFCQLLRRYDALIADRKRQLAEKPIYIEKPILGQGTR